MEHHLASRRVAAVVDAAAVAVDADCGGDCDGVECLHYYRMKLHRTSLSYPSPIPSDSCDDCCSLSPSNRDHNCRSIAAHCVRGCDGLYGPCSMGCDASSCQPESPQRQLVSVVVLASSRRDALKPAADAVPCLLLLQRHFHQYLRHRHHHHSFRTEASHRAR